MPRLPLILTASLVALATAASADTGVDITIYADNQALVQDTRQVTFTGAPQKVEFKNVSAQIRPETASLAASDMRIIEQNFDYDLLSPAKIMENAVGQTITLVRTNPATGAETREQALVLAANGGVVLQIGNRIEVLRDDGLPGPAQHARRSDSFDHFARQSRYARSGAAVSYSRTWLARRLCCALR
jgi:hypothetical protein